jgi:hypothetical protein
MVRLRSVGVVSCAKISAILHGAMGVLVALVVVIAGLAGLAATPSPQKLGILGILIVAAIMPFFYALLGFLFGALSALLYNWSASAIGGIEMELQAVPLAYVPAHPQAPTANPVA